jgi:hypothetical protein
MNARVNAPRLQVSWRAKCAAGASLVMVLSMATLVSSATPSFASSYKSAGSSSTYCKLLTAYDKKQTAANKALDTPGAEKAAMEAAFRNLKPEEAVVLGVAPSSLQSAYKTLFKDINQLYADLAKANYNFEHLSKAQIAAFEAMSKAMAPATAKINAYNKNVCGVKD